MSWSYWGALDLGSCGHRSRVLSFVPPVIAAWFAHSFSQSIPTCSRCVWTEQPASSASHLEEEITAAPVGPGTLLPCSESRHTHCAQERLRCRGHHYSPSSLRGERQKLLRIMSNCPQNILFCSKQSLCLHGRGWAWHKVLGAWVLTCILGVFWDLCVWGMGMRDDWQPLPGVTAKGQRLGSKCNDEYTVTPFLLVLHYQDTKDALGAREDLL